MNRRGYTLLEVLVATTIMAVAVVGLLSNLSASLFNAARLTDSSRAALLARRTADELLTRPDVPKGTDIGGQWDPAVVGIEGGWRARLTPYERAVNAAAGQMGLERLELEIWWISGGARRSLTLEAFRAARLDEADMQFAPMAP